MRTHQKCYKNKTTKKDFGLTHKPHLYIMISLSTEIKRLRLHGWILVEHK